MSVIRVKTRATGSKHRESYWPFDYGYGKKKIKKAAARLRRVEDTKEVEDALQSTDPDSNHLDQYAEWN